MLSKSSAHPSSIDAVGRTNRESTSPIRNEKLPKLNHPVFDNRNRAIFDRLDELPGRPCPRSSSTETQHALEPEDEACPPQAMALSPIPRSFRIVFLPKADTIPSGHFISMPIRLRHVSRHSIEVMEIRPRSPSLDHSQADVFAIAQKRTYPIAA